jgi:hypothetical protein
MFVERKVRYSALFTNLVGWHAGAVSFPLSDIILAQLACPLSDIMFCLHSEYLTNLSTNIGVTDHGHNHVYSTSHYIYNLKSSQFRIVTVFIVKANEV